MIEVDGLVRVELRGGPADFPEELRYADVSPETEKVKISYLGGYEHFERGTPDDGIYRWTLRTRIAE
jgi:hypothetical protein